MMSYPKKSNLLRVASERVELRDLKVIKNEEDIWEVSWHIYGEGDHILYFDQDSLGQLFNEIQSALLGSKLNDNHN